MMTEITLENPWDRSLHDDAYKYWKMEEPSAATVLAKPSVVLRMAIAIVLGLGSAQLFLMMPIGPVGMTHVLALMVGALGAHLYMLIIMDLKRRKANAVLSEDIKAQSKPTKLVMNADGHRWHYPCSETRFDWSLIDEAKLFSTGIAMRMDNQVATLPTKSFPEDTAVQSVFEQIEAWREAAA